MMRSCAALSVAGTPCKAAPLVNENYCLLHHPEHADAVQKARREGGRRRKKEAQVATVYDFAGLESIQDIRRLLEIAVIDTLSLPNSLSRSRELARLAREAMMLLEKGPMDERLRAIEDVLRPRLAEVGGDGG